MSNELGGKFMFQKVRKKIINKAIIKIIVCIAVIIGTLVYTDMAPIKLVKGPEKIDIDNVDLDKYEGKYIKAKVAYVYNSFLEEVTYKKNKFGSKSAGEVTARYYITDVNLSQYLALRADGDYLMNKFDVLMDNTQISIDKGTEPVAYSYRGSFVKLSKREYSELKSIMTQAGLSEDMYSDYIFKVNYVGKVDEAYAITGCGVIIFAVIFALLSIIRALSSRYTKDARKFAVNNGIPFEQLCMELDGAYETSNVWITTRYTAYIRGNKIRVLKNQDYIWAYYKETRTTKKGVTSVTRQIALADRNKKFTFITIASEDDARNILSIYAETQPQIVLGFNDDLQKLFMENFEQFLMLPYQKASSEEETAPSKEQVPEEQESEVRVPEEQEAPEGYIPEEYVPEEYVPETYDTAGKTTDNNISTIEV